jgi:hypothetical protein
MDYNQIARILLVLGALLLFAGAGFYLFSRLNLPSGKIPGDLLLIRENFTCLLPLTSSLIISIVLTVLINILVLLLKK